MSNPLFRVDPLYDGPQGSPSRPADRKSGEALEQPSSESDAKSRDKTSPSETDTTAAEVNQPRRPPQAATSGPPKEAAQDDIAASPPEAGREFEMLGRMYSALKGPTAIALAGLFGGLLLLFVCYQVFSLISMLATLPSWLAGIGVVLMSLLLAVVAWSLYRLVTTYVQRQPVRQIRLNDIEQLRRHDRIRRPSGAASHKPREARESLEKYVRDYRQWTTDAGTDGQPSPQTSDTSVATLDAYPFSAEQVKQLKKFQDKLSNPNHNIPDTREWLQVYETKFQSVLDSVARDRVRQCARWVGVKTAISPNALVDTIIVIYWSFVLLRDLCRIYNVRVGGLGTAALLWRAFFAAYVAGRLQEWEESTEETVESLMEGLGQVGAKVAGKITAKAGSGLVNYYLVSRTGKRAIELLQPLAADVG